MGYDVFVSSPRVGFPGLKKGDKWCLCAPRWKEAFDDGMAPLVDLEATEESTLQIIRIETLKEFSYNWQIIRNWKQFLLRINQPQEIVIHIFHIKSHIYLEKINKSNQAGTILLIN